jgi:hypothetical protein
MLNCKKTVAYRKKLTSYLNSAHPNHVKTNDSINATNFLLTSESEDEYH